MCTNTGLPSRKQDIYKHILTVYDIQGLSLSTEGLKASLSYNFQILDYNRLAKYFYVSVTPCSLISNSRAVPDLNI